MHFLSLFPQLFFLSPLSATLLRLAAAIVIGQLAYFYWSHRDTLAQVDVMIVGRTKWIPLMAAIFSVIVSLGLLLGLYTQLAAILGAVSALKALIWKRRYPEFIPLSRTSSALLLVICVSLVVTGAGAFAIDWPL